MTSQVTRSRMTTSTKHALKSLKRKATMHPWSYTTRGIFIKTMLTRPHNSQPIRTTASFQTLQKQTIQSSMSTTAKTIHSSPMSLRFHLSIVTHSFALWWSPNSALKISKGSLQLMRATQLLLWSAKCMFLSSTFLRLRIVWLISCSQLPSTTWRIKPTIRSLG